VKLGAVRKILLVLEHSGDLLLPTDECTPRRASGGETSRYAGRKYLYIRW